MVMRERRDQVCVLPGDPSWFEGVVYLEALFGVLEAAAEATADGDAAGMPPPLTFGVAEGAVARVREDVLDPEAGLPTFRLFVLPAHELDALWQVLESLRSARSGDADAAGVLEVVAAFCSHSVPSRTVDAVIGDLERVLTLLSLDIPAVKDLATAVCLDVPSHGLDPEAAYEDITRVWRTAGIIP
ncbi:hypothetical protein ACN20G_37095 (plasmid) [Streptomyces sp. BI20]|uniref:hypothetical protein n=1 Tax=Streptomyces sp. BI20 TaxID=3403460 RepID=UPI003C77A5F1